MPISDLISTSFLFSISIIIILIGGIFAYVSYRMSEQDHKLTSMLGLVSTLAEEMHSLKIRQTEVVDDDDDNTSRKEIHIFDQNILSGGADDINLISVSDNESCSESEGSDSDSNEDSDSDSDSDEEPDSEEELEPENNVKVLNISSFNESNDDFKEDFNEELLEGLEGLEELEDLIEDLNIKSIHLAEPIDLNYSAELDSTELDSASKLESVLDISDLKSIMISDKPDYKKMGLNKLREVVVERNILPTIEAAKLKKPELLKLLEE